MYAPFEECTEEQYNALEAILPDVDLSTVQYAEKDDGRESSASCEGGLCELKLGV
jgi:hypothetical protein